MSRHLRYWVAYPLGDDYSPIRARRKGTVEDMAARWPERQYGPAIEIDYVFGLDTIEIVLKALESEGDPYWEGEAQRAAERLAEALHKEEPS